jgi:hydrogenase expression/formation protein HypC
MCLSVPGQVIELNGADAKVDVSGNTVNADTSLLPDVEVGDWVLLHAGFAIQIYDEDEARETLRTLREVYEAAHR